MGVKITTKGDFKKTEKWLAKMEHLEEDAGLSLKTIADKTLGALKEATPKDTGLTANSWYYNIIKTKGKYSIEFCNSNMAKDGVEALNIVLLLELGHATASGSWVSGLHFVEPTVERSYAMLLEDAKKLLK